MRGERVTGAADRHSRRPMGHDGARRPTPHQHGRPDVTVPTGPRQPPASMVVPAFFIRQRITLMVNRYEVVGINPDGSEGALLAFAEQKRMKLKEEVVFYADTSKSRSVFRFKARQRLRSEEHTSELQSRQYLVCRLLLEKKKKKDADEF